MNARIDTGTDYTRLIEKDRIHSSLYTDEAIFEDELRRIFYGGWVFVGHESEVAQPGDYVCRTIGLEPIVMLRDKRLEVRVLSNRCTHRGNTLCRQEKGSTKVLTCDYHGWTFSLDGELLGVPFPGGLCKEKAELRLRGPAKVPRSRGQHAGAV